MLEFCERTKTKNRPQDFREPDHRFSDLLPKAEWNKLPIAVRRRFSKVVTGGESLVYSGQITQMRQSFWGYTLAQLLRPFGAPLPLSNEIGTPTIVSVTEDRSTGGQIWTRLYANRTGFPQIVQSAKRFLGPTGLEEYIGFGVSMRLKTQANKTGLVFESAGYVFRLLGIQIKLPRFLVPLDLIVQHKDLESGRFVFTLELTSPLLGELIHQEGQYHEE